MAHCLQSLLNAVCRNWWDGSAVKFLPWNHRTPHSNLCFKHTREARWGQQAFVIIIPLVRQEAETDKSPGTHTPTGLWYSSADSKETPCLQQDERWIPRLEIVLWPSHELQCMDDPGYMHVHTDNITFKHKIYVMMTLFRVTSVISKLSFK